MISPTTKMTWTVSSAKTVLKTSHPKLREVNKYILGVLDGSEVSGYLVKLAVIRHLDDLATGHQRGLSFSQDAALRVIKLWPRIFNLTAGDGVIPFVLSPWEQFCMANLFGWMGADGFRRFRTAYIEIGKGNGKSPWAAAIALYGLVGDKETAAQIYCCATKKEQAKDTLFNEAVLMVQNSPWLRARLQVNRDNIAYLKTASFFRVISSDTKGVDGPRPHMVIVDEVHMQPNAILVDKLRAGFKNRRQPLIVEITNSGEDQTTVCFAHHEFSENVLKGITPNDTWFGFVCTLDPCDDCRDEGKSQPSSSCKKCDDWRDEKVWKKANPNLGISIQPKYLRELVAEAAGMPTKQNMVKRLNFCIWVQGSNRWMSTEKWDECQEHYDWEELKGKLCYGGLDMSNKIDLTAFLLHFPELGRVLSFFWVPQDNMAARKNNDRVPYDDWSEHANVPQVPFMGPGWIKPTPGNGVSYAHVREDIKKLAELFNVEEIGYDEWNTEQLAQELQAEGLKMIVVPQKLAHMTSPMKELELLVHTKRLRHDGNPVLRWCMSNMVAFKDASGNIRPDKEKSKERIDGSVALITALNRTIVHFGSRGSAYEDHGVFAI
jgi:phage terminase large subunit-like protein